MKTEKKTYDEPMLGLLYQLMLLEKDNIFLLTNVPKYESYIFATFSVRGGAA